MSLTTPTTKIPIWIVAPSFRDVPSFTIVREDIIYALKTDPRIASITFVLVDDTAGQDPELSAFSSQLTAQLNRTSGVQPSIPTTTQILTPPYNLGHQGAIVFALRALKEQVPEEAILITMDSDGEDRPEDLPKLLDPLFGSPHNLHLVALAQRTQRNEAPVFKALYFGFKIIFRILTGIIIKNGNYAAMRGWFTREIIFHPHFDQAYASTFLSLPLQIRAVPLPRGNRIHGRSRMGYQGLVSHGIRMLMPFTEKIATRGLIFFGLTFAVCFSLAVFWSLLTFTWFATLAWVGFCANGVAFATFSQSKSRSLRGLFRFNSQILKQ